MMRLAALTAVCLCLPSPTLAQSATDLPSDEWFAAMEFRNLGPFRGGRVTAVEGIPDQPFTFYIGTTGGGVWRTTTGGQTWHNVSDG